MELWIYRPLCVPILVILTVIVLVIIETSVLLVSWQCMKLYEFSNNYLFSICLLDLLEIVRFSPS